MAFKPLSSFLQHAATAQTDLSTLASNVAEQARYREFLKGALPDALYADVTSLATRNASLAITVRSHATATKLYQYQQRVLSQFAANGLNFKEIRVFVQSPLVVSTAVKHRPVLPPEAVIPLEKAAENTENTQLKNALKRLSSHAKAVVNR
jgi:hypothetical protein